MMALTCFMVFCDVQGLMEAAEVDEHDLARAILQGSNGLNERLDGQDGNDVR